MLKAVFIAVLVSFMGNAQNFITINDENFAGFLVKEYPTCMNGQQLNVSCGAILTVESLNLNGLQISNLEGLQAFVNLKSLECVENNLTNLPALPLNLVKLDCSMNQITNLPSLPLSLEELSCAVNHLTHIPSLPASLKIIYCNFNEIISLPTLPSTLEYLACGSNKITCLPALPSTIFIGDIALNPLKCVSSYADWMDEESQNLPICSVRDEATNENRCICISTSLLSADINSTMFSNLENSSNESVTLSDVSIFPNPFKGNITVKSKDIINTIAIRDIEGKIIPLESLTTNAISSTQVELDLSELINGVYFIETTVDNSVTTYKVIKSN